LRFTKIGFDCFFEKEYKNMTTTEILTKELTNFIESLRFAGYNIGATQYIAAQDLILTLAAQSKLPSELTELRQFLAPILCHSPKEQAEFDTHFNQWVNKFPQTKITSETETSPLSDVESELRTIKKGSTLWKWGLIAFAMVFIFSIFVYWSDIIYLLEGNEISQPVNEIALPRQQNSDEITQPIQLDEIQPVSPSLWDKLLSLSLQGWFTLLSPLLLLLLWKLWWWYRAQLFLARQSTTTLPDIRKLFVKGIDDKFFQSKGLARTAQQLRKHISMPVNLLDVDATVDKTIQSGGWFTPITGTIKIRPQYLALIDRTTFNDHQTQLINSLINQLVADDVLVTRYYFDTVPRRCYPQQSKQAPFTLPELAQHYPDHRLLIFSDGNGLVNPITGKVVNWIEQFSWSQKALFTLESPDQWGYREQILDGADFLILPANEEGLQGLVEQINTGTWQPEPTDSFAGEFPEYLQERPRRWLEHHAPDAPVLIELLKQVRNFLGDAAYYWFSACAIYPELRWQLTLYLGEQLKSLTVERLAKLARLPWFRYGYMPDWLREQLIKELSLPQEREIRAALYNRLLETSDKPLSDFNLEIAKPQQNALSTRLLSKLAKKAPKNSPLHDHVFMTFMGNKLAVKIPKFLRNLFAKSKVTENKSHEAKLPNLFSLLWLVLMQPITLRHRLKACGIGNPDASIFKLWLAKDETRSIKHQYIKQLLVLLLIVMPISWIMLYIYFGPISGYYDDFFIRGMDGTAFVFGGVVGSLIGGMVGGMDIVVAIGIVFGMAFNMAFIVFGGGIGNLVASLLVFTVIGNSVIGSTTRIVAASVAASVAITIILGIKFIFFGNIPNIVSSITYSVPYGIATFVAIGMAIGTAKSVNKGIAMNVFRGVVGGIVISMVFIVLVLTFIIPLGLSYPVYSNVDDAYFLTLLFIVGHLHLLIYPIEALWQLICYTIQKMTNISTLRFVPILYHNLSYLPHPFLARHIVLGAKTEPELAQKVIDACAFSPGQCYTGQIVLAYLHADTPHIFSEPSFKFQVTINKQGEIINRNHKQAKYYTEDLGNGVTLDMVSIPSGTFLMGSPETEKGRNEDEGPQHAIMFPPFFMGKYPITQAQWQAVMGNNPSYFMGKKRPVENVSWHEAVAFCNKLSELTGKIYYLPSEAEWEYACRAGIPTPFQWITTPFHFGETITSDFANYYGESTYADEPKGIFRGKTTNVDRFPPNAFGLFDMHGNIWEWCADQYHYSYRGAPTDGSAWENKYDRQLPRAIRGGSWADPPTNCRAASRRLHFSESSSQFLGFRVAATQTYLTSIM
jgi:formylglycine-generating enzyme required for sulfatase activity